MTIRTRFAPSPTGFLHIGNVRTALINYLFAKKNYGKFLLRIEDTDKARSTDDAINVIFEGLKWLNLDYDEEAIFQSKNIENHKKAVQSLLDKGQAYKCYASNQEIEELKKNSNGKIIYPDRNGNKTKQGEYVVRLKSPIEGETTINDLIQGKVTIKHSELDDFILLRSDGTPTYMLAVVVDDINMGITHIIRGDDHLINAFRQSILYNALGAKIPNFAHLPLIHGSDGAKLSKRHGALSITDWRDNGYPSQMMCDYLMRMGWANDDGKLSKDDAIKRFDISKINKSPSRLNIDHISHLSAMYIRDMEPQILISQLNKYLEETNKKPYNEDTSINLISVINLFAKRIDNFKDLNKELEFFKEIPDKDEKAKELLNDTNNIENLKSIYSIFSDLNNWSIEDINNSIKYFLKEKGLKMPQIGPVIRSAIAGRTSTPDLAPVLSALGKNTTLERIEKEI